MLWHALARARRRLPGPLFTTGNGYCRLSPFYNTSSKSAPAAASLAHYSLRNMATIDSPRFTIVNAHPAPPAGGVILRYFRPYFTNAQNQQESSKRAPTPSAGRPCLRRGGKGPFYIHILRVFYHGERLPSNRLQQSERAVAALLRKSASKHECNTLNEMQ